MGAVVAELCLAPAMNIIVHQIIIKIRSSKSLQGDVKLQASRKALPRLGAWACFIGKASPTLPDIEYA